MQAKDISEKPVLRFLFLLDQIRRLGTWRKNCETSVMKAMPEGTPEKLARAKMRQLIKRGLVDGCPCGCRGDYRITEKGTAVLYQ